MTQYSHIIMRQRLEVEIPDKKYQQEVQRKAYKLLQDALNEVLDSILSAEVPDDVVITLDQLHINLAETEHELLEQNVLQKIQNKLPIILKEQINLAIQDPLKKRITPLPEAKLKAIKHYLSNGYFAWWMPSNNEKIIEELYLEVYKNSPNVIKNLWSEIGQELPAIQRFLNYFSSSTIEKSIILLSPAYGPQILKIAEDFKTLETLFLKIVQISKNKRLHIVANHNVLAQAIQSLSLNNKFNETVFLKNCFQEVAEELNIAYPALIAGLTRELSSNNTKKIGLNTNLLNHIVRLHDTQHTDYNSNNTTSARLPLLIKELDGLLSQPQDVSKDHLSTTFNKLIEYKKDPTVKEVLSGYIQSPHHGHQLTRLLSTTDFINLIKAIQPDVEKGFILIKQLLEANIAQESEDSRLIEHLTIKYLDKRLPPQQEPNNYIGYIIRKLALYKSEDIKKWAPYIQENKSQLTNEYTTQVIDLVLTALPVDHTTPSSNKDINSASITNVLTQVFEKIQKNAGYKPTPLLTDLIGKFYNQLSVLVEKETSITSVLKKELENTIHEILKQTIQDNEELTKVTKKVRTWLHNQLQSSKANHITNELKLVYDEAKKTLTKFIPITVSQTQDFFEEQLLPPAYTHQHAFVANVVKQMTTSPAYKTEVLKLLSHKSVRKVFTKKLEPTTRNVFINTVLPISPELKEVYMQILLKADVLRASTIPDKQILLDEIFLEIASKRPTSTEDEFIQLSVLSLSSNTKLPKSEIYRRISLVAQKHAPNSPIFKKLQENNIFPDTGLQEVADKIDAAFLPLYRLIAGVVTPQTLASSLYAQLVAFLKKLIQENLADIDKELLEKINELFNTLSIQQKQNLFLEIKRFVLDAISEQNQALQDSWISFLETGEITEENQTPAKLFNNLLDFSLKLSEISNHNLANISNLQIDLEDSKHASLAQMLKVAMKSTSCRKRLVSSLPTQDLDKVIDVIAPEKSKIFHAWIHRIHHIWEYAGISSLNQQETKLAWWETALLTLANSDNLSEKTWLVDSITNFSKLIDMHPSTMVSTLIAGANQLNLPPTTSSQAENLEQLIIQIQEDWKTSTKETAQQAWPEHPTFQQLHKLLTIGVSGLDKDNSLGLDEVEQQLNHLIIKQPIAVKQFLSSYQDYAVTSRQIAHYFSTPLINQIIHVLDSNAAPYIQAYLHFSTSPNSNFYKEKSIDKFTWHRCNLIGTLTYLLKRKGSYFDEKEYLQENLTLVEHYIKQDIQPIIQGLVTYNTINQPSPIAKQLLHQLKTIFAINNDQEKFTTEQENVQEELITQDQPSKKDHNQEEDAPLLKRKKKDQQPDKELNIYIRNSGLIFIWPFLEELLTKQRLLEGQEFITKIDHNNALHALQYLVTEELSTPDWRIILNKLLCGMEYNEVTYAGYYLWDKKDFAKTILQQQEKELLKDDVANNASQKTTQLIIPEEIELLKKNTNETLNNVLQNWGDLKKLEKFEPFRQGFGLQHLREYILQRDGVLRYIEQEEDEGYWHLTITWEPYDAEIKNLPWPINKIYLPFMKEKLVVFWLPD